MHINSISDFRKAVRTGRYAWPGGYPTYFICDDGTALCHDCAKKERRLILDAIAYPEYRSSWEVIGFDINWKDPELYCDNCNARIESAYGED
jgi:hypothetical protein